MDLSKKRLSAKVVKSQTQKITVALIGNAASGKEIAVPEDIKDSFSNIKIIFLILLCYSHWIKFQGALSHSHAMICCF